MPLGKCFLGAHKLDPINPVTKLGWQVEETQPEIPCEVGVLSLHRIHSILSWTCTCQNYLFGRHRFRRVLERILYKIETSVLQRTSPGWSSMCPPVSVPHCFEVVSTFRLNGDFLEMPVNLPQTWASRWSLSVIKICWRFIAFKVFYTFVSQVHEN